MGLFKKKKSPAEVAADLAKDRGDYISYFQLKYKEEIGAWEELITTSRQRMNKHLTEDQRLGILRESKSLMDGFHAWCSERKYGEEYFQFAYNQSDRSMYQRVISEIEAITK